MAAPNNQGPIDHDDINGWTTRLNNELGNLGQSFGEQSKPDAREWSSSLFGCFNPIDLCAITCCLPCITFGKTHHRTQKDASMAGYSAVNTSCLLFCGSGCFGLAWIPAWMQRADVRRKYNLQGNCLTDLLLTCCCGCCSLIQQEKETEALLEKAAQHDAGYKMEGQMQYQ